MLLVHVTCLYMGGIRTQFGWHIRSLLVAKNSLLPYHWKRRYIFFLMVQRVSALVEWFVTRRPFFFPFLFSFSSPKNYILIIFIVDILTWVLILLILNFCSWFFIKVLFVFNSVHQFQFDILFFSSWSLFF
jgi:hypothetical protein